VQYLTLNILGVPRPTLDLAGHATHGDREGVILQPVTQLNKAILKRGNVESPVIIGQNEGTKGHYICPRIQGVILPTLGQKTPSFRFPIHHS